MSAPKTAEAKLLAARRDKLRALRDSGWNYPNDFRPSRTAAQLRAMGEAGDEVLDARIAGRLRSRRVMGKSAFAHLQDGSGQLQIMARRDLLGDDAYAAFRAADLGDVLGARGRLIRTRAGEWTLEAAELRMLCKALRPLPEKFHGLADVEQRYRRRYLDLIVNDDVRAVFARRSRILACLRAELAARGFLEVETPMMQPVAGGAAARPFATRHNALGQDLYLRVAPELYLKRLVVGGFERIYELNRCFRNEGVSSRHNPEFTMLEVYQAHADYRDMMDLIEALLRGAAQAAADGAEAPLAAAGLDAPFARTTLRDALRARHPQFADADWERSDQVRALCREHGVDADADRGLGGLLFDLFEATVAPDLDAPTFVTEYPLEVSPLARRCAAGSEWVERFELFAGGRELANGFSELNDPEDQAQRFLEQARRRAGGDVEAMQPDPDYIRALEHGLPPTAGLGLGVDRLAMLLCGVSSIRDVLLFPHLRAREEAD